MRVAVRYFTYSKLRNTKRLADAVADELGVKAKPISEPISKKTDILFVCQSAYMMGMHDEVAKWTKTLDNDIVRNIVNLSTHAFFGDPWQQMKAKMIRRGVHLYKHSFVTKGQLGSLNKGHPNAEDLQDARAFVRQSLIDYKKGDF